MSGGLGSLAQSVLRTQFKATKTILVSIGLLIAVVNFAAAATADRTFTREVKKLQEKGRTVYPGRLETGKRSAQLVGIAFGVLGLLFIGLGSWVEFSPVPITILALVLYLAWWATSVVLVPPSITFQFGIITLIKFIIAIVLARSVQTAIVYERARSAAYRRA